MNSWEGSAYYPSGPNPAKRPLCPMPIFPIVSGPDFSCCWSFNLICKLWSYWEIFGPLNTHLTLSLPGITHTYFLHRDLKVLRCHAEPLFGWSLGRRDASISQKHKLPFIILTGISLAGGTFNCHSRTLKLILGERGAGKRWPWNNFCRVSQQPHGFSLICNSLWLL